MATAYHEAGHAVACWNQRIAVRRVTIVSEDGRDGDTVHANPLRSLNLYGPTTPRMRARVEALVLVAFAGPAAEARFSGRSRIGWRAMGGQCDVDEAVGFLRTICGDTEELEAYLNWLVVRAWNLTGTSVNWPATQSVAEALLKHQTLTGKMVKKAIQESLGPPFPPGP